MWMKIKILIKQEICFHDDYNVYNFIWYHLIIYDLYIFDFQKSSFLKAALLGNAVFCKMKNKRKIFAIIYIVICEKDYGNQVILLFTHADFEKNCTNICKDIRENVIYGCHGNHINKKKIPELFLCTCPIMNLWLSDWSDTICPVLSSLWVMNNCSSKHIKYKIRQMCCHLNYNICDLKDVPHIFVSKKFPSTCSKENVVIIRGYSRKYGLLHNWIWIS